MANTPFAGVSRAINAPRVLLMIDAFKVPRDALNQGDRFAQKRPDGRSRHDDGFHSMRL